MYKLLLMCVNNYQIWLRQFKDKSNNLRWPRVFWTTLYNHKRRLHERNCIAYVYMYVIYVCETVIV